MLCSSDLDLYQYDFEKHDWIAKQIIELTEREKAILTLAAQGNKEWEIAKALNRSHDSIKTSKRILFRKLGVHKMSEAITYSLNNNLLL